MGKSPPNIAVCSLNRRKNCYPLSSLWNPLLFFLLLRFVLRKFDLSNWYKNPVAASASPLYFWYKWKKLENTCMLQQRCCRYIISIKLDVSQNWLCSKPPVRIGVRLISLTEGTGGSCVSPNSCYTLNGYLRILFETWSLVTGWTDVKNIPNRIHKISGCTVNLIFFYFLNKQRISSDSV